MLYPPTRIPSRPHSPLQNYRLNLLPLAHHLEFLESIGFVKKSTDSLERPWGGAVVGAVESSKVPEDDAPPPSPSDTTAILKEAVRLLDSILLDTQPNAQSPPIPVTAATSQPPESRGWEQTEAPALKSSGPTPAAVSDISSISNGLTPMQMPGAVDAVRSVSGPPRVVGGTTTTSATPGRVPSFQQVQERRGKGGVPLLNFHANIFFMQYALLVWLLRVVIRFRRKRWRRVKRP